MAREFVIRLKGLPADASWPVWKLDRSSGWAGGEVCVRGQPAKDLLGISAGLPKSARTVTVKVGIALGAWQTVAKQVPGGSGMTSFSHEGSNWVVSFTKPESTEGGARILVVHTVKDRDLRVLAVDKDDQEHISSGSESSGTDAFSHITAKFPGLPLEQVKEFQFQVRPYQWVEFHGVALHPKQPGAVTGGMAFGPVSEQVLPRLQTSGADAVLLDLDTGRWATNADFDRETLKSRQWLSRTGADLAAGHPELPIVVGYDMVFSPAEGTAWESCTPADVLNHWALKANECEEAALADKTEGRPDIYFFRTREDGRGILQILGTSTNPPGVKLRYKRVATASKPAVSWQRGFRAKEQWEDAGASTPEAALQTLLRAGRETARDRLADMTFLPRHRTRQLRPRLFSKKSCAPVS